MLKQKSSEYRGFRNAGIRLTEDMLPQLGQIYGARIPTLMPAIHAFDKAHVVMLVAMLAVLLRRRDHYAHC